MKQYVKLFEHFIAVNEADTLEMAGLAKKIYNGLKAEGRPVAMDYQNEKMAKRGTSAKFGDRYEKPGDEFELTVSYMTDSLGKKDWVHVVGFETKEDAQNVVDKYTPEGGTVTGKVTGQGGHITATFQLNQEERRSKFDLNRGYHNVENKNDRKRKR